MENNLNHFAVLLKLTQHCESTILQFRDRERGREKSCLLKGGLCPSVSILTLCFSWRLVLGNLRCTGSPGHPPVPPKSYRYEQVLTGETLWDGKFQQARICGAGCTRLVCSSLFPETELGLRDLPAILLSTLLMRRVPATSKETPAFDQLSGSLGGGRLDT